MQRLTLRPWRSTSIWRLQGFLHWVGPKGYVLCEVQIGLGRNPSASWPDQSEFELLFVAIYSIPERMVQRHNKQEGSQRVTLQNATQDLRGFCVSIRCSNLGQCLWVCKVSAIAEMISAGTPQMQRISIRFPWFMVSKALRKSMKVRMQLRLLARTPSRRRLRATMCPKVVILCLKTFWQALSRGSSAGLNLFMLIRFHDRELRLIYWVYSLSSQDTKTTSYLMSLIWFNRSDTLI